MTTPALLVRVAAVTAVVAALAGCSSSDQAADHDAAGTGSSAASSPSPASSSGAVPAAGSAAPSAASSAGATTRAPSGGGVDRCHTSELTGRLVPGDPGAGQRHATLVLTDTGGQTCTIDGFGGLGLADAQGHALPTQQVRSGSAGGVVTLRPGAAVSTQLSWGAVPGTGDSQSGDCQPTAAALQVIPPDETDPLSVTWTGGPVCEGGTIRQTAYAAG